jgi:hypothetical protein
MRWDDLQLLRWIDELEQTNHAIANGLDLLKELNHRDGLPIHEGVSEFAKELALAHNAGFMTWTDRSSDRAGGIAEPGDSARPATPPTGLECSTTSSSP